MAVRFDEVRARVTGRWDHVLPALGIDAAFLRDKHGPCPGCGGKDRFRYDDKEGRGTFFCSGMNGAGDGFDLLAHVHGWDGKTAMERVAEVLGIAAGAPVDQRVLQQAAAEARVRHDVEASARQAAEAKAAERATSLWQRAKPAPFEHGYLQAKGIAAEGVRLLPAGRGMPETLLVPLFDADGRLWSVQRIYAEGGADGQPVTWSKRHLKDGRKRGCFLLLGTPGARVLVCEGYATGVSLYACSGLAVAVAFDAGGLATVAGILRERWPSADVVVAADNDAFKEGNPGLTAARRAADRAGVRVAFPIFQDHEGRWKDWNDLHQRGGADEVRQQLAGQLDEVAEATSSTPAPPAPSEPVSSQRHGPYLLNGDGLYFCPEGGDSPPMYVCQPLHIDAQCRDGDSGSWGLLVRFADRDGCEKELVIPQRLLTTDGAQEAVSLLVDRGFRLGAARQSRNRLVEYLKAANPPERARLVSALGWHGDAYMLPARIIGSAAERLVFEAAGKQLNPAAERGALADWQQRVAALCAGNHRLVFAVSAGFAAPLLALIGAESGGFHFYGDSSLGKSTLSRVAASVYGPPAYEQSWRQTDNALESIAASRSDALLLLDEIKQCDPRIIGETVYMLGNGRGKGRAGDTGAMRKPVTTWRLLFLSNGEKTLEQHMQEAGKGVHAGMDVRLIGVPADAGTGHGIFDCIHDFPTGAALSDHLKAAAGQCYGTPVVAFLERLMAGREQAAERVVRRMDVFLQREVPAGASGQVKRVAARFGLVAAAGEEATDMGVTGWIPGAAGAAASACFHAWLAVRGGYGAQEDTDVLAAVRLFIERYGESRFSDLRRIDDSHAPRTADRVGYRELLPQYGGMVYYVLPESFKSELCRGFSHMKVARLLADKGMLVAEGGSSRSLTRKKQVSGEGAPRFYWIKGAALMESDEGVPEAA